MILNTIDTIYNVLSHQKDICRHFIIGIGLWEIFEITEDRLTSW